jgi:hypothetical protein
MRGGLPATLYASCNFPDLNRWYLQNKKDPNHGAVKLELYNLKKKKPLPLQRYPVPRVLRTQWQPGIIEDTISGSSSSNGSGILESKFYSA